MRATAQGKVRVALWTAGALVLVAAGAAAATVYWGLYDVSATHQHTRPVFWLLDTTLRRAVIARARTIVPPPLDDPALVRRGLVHYREACLHCHGAPGVARREQGMRLTPVPDDLAQAAHEWTAAELYWVTRNGIKMTGMPAWALHFSDEELWAIVAFVKQLPRLSAADYAALAQEALKQSQQRPPDTAVGVARQGDEARGLLRRSTEQGRLEADEARGELALRQYGCTACHRIPGMVGPDAHTGPPLHRIGSRKYLAGRLPNSEQNLVRWIRAPREISPQTLMPDLGVTENHARDMAAYLWALK